MNTERLIWAFFAFLFLILPTTFWLLGLSFEILNTALPFALLLTLLAAVGTVALAGLALYGLYVYVKEDVRVLDEEPLGLPAKSETEIKFERSREKIEHRS